MLVATASDIHLERKRGLTREQGLEEVRRAIVEATELGVSNLAVRLEDASRASIDYLETLARISAYLQVSVPRRLSWLTQPVMPRRKRSDI